MTVQVATLALLTAAMSHKIGSDSRRAFAIVIVGGFDRRPHHEQLPPNDRWPPPEESRSVSEPTNSEYC